jgi:D-alanine-D-alanine ligase
VAVLHDQVPAGAPPEAADNLVQAREAAAALAALGHAARPAAFGPDARAAAGRLAALAPEMVFNLVEAPLGRARLIHLAPMLLERLGLPFTGSGSAALLATSNKLLAKRALVRAGLPTPEWAAPPLPPEGPGPGLWLVKSVWEHGSAGIGEGSLARGDRPGAVAALLARRREELGGEWFAERYLEGREFNLSLLAGREGPAALPLAEIVFQGFAGRPRLVGYRAKWEPGSFEYLHTPRRFDLPPADRPLAARLKRLGLAAWRLFGLGGWARVDFRVDHKGRPWILEVNANPCLAPEAGFMAAARRAGLDREAVVARVLAHPRRPARRPRGEPRRAAV